MRWSVIADRRDATSRAEARDLASPVARARAGLALAAFFTGRPRPGHAAQPSADILYYGPRAGGTQGFSPARAPRR